MVDLLLKTKLHIPTLRSGFVARPSLRAKLYQALRHKLTLLSAPAGFGKTTLLAEWINGKAVPTHNAGGGRVFQVAWLSLDEGDNDPTRFWSYVAAALETIHPDIAETALGLRQSPQPSAIDAVLTAFINAIAEWNETVVVVFDDYHVIHAPPIHDSIQFFLEHLPANLHLVMTTRSDPPFALAQLRARGQLLELRASDLRFTSDQVAAFLNQVMGLELNASDIAALETRTEGWIAGLQLAALSMQGRADVKNFIAAFTGSHRYIISYLVEQVLDRQSEAIQQFLLETSLLTRMNAELCNAVTERDDSDSLLEYVEASNLFLIPLDERSEWYRYHHLFADVLQTRLQKIQPARIPELHRRASLWFAAHGLPDEAVKHALAANDAERAARLIEQNIDSMSNRGEYVTLKNWLEQLPEAIIRVHPRLAVFRVSMLVVTHELDEAERYLDEIEPELSSEARSGSNDAQKILNQALSERITISLARRDLAHTLELAKRALDLFPPDEFRLRGEVKSRLATAYYWLDQTDAARATFSEAAQLSERAGDVNMVIVSQSYEATVLIAQGEFNAALRLFGQIFRTAEQHGITSTSAARLAYQDYGELLYERNQLREARFHLEQAIEQSERGHYTRLLVWALVPFARLLQAQGNSTNALATIQRAAQIVQEYGLPPFYSAQINECQVQLWLAQGNPTAASNWARSRGLSIDDELTFIQEPEYRALARVLMTEGEYARALELLSRLEKKAQRAGRKRHVIQAQVLQAPVWSACGNPAQAIGALERALTLAEPEDYIRTFVDEGETMKLLISNFKLQIEKRAPDETTRKLLGYTDKLLAAFPQLATTSASKSKIINQKSLARRTTAETPGRAEILLAPLTDRELEILRLLATGRTNPEIASNLVIAVGTVKKYTNNIFSKLGVTNRTLAVARARELGLL